MYGSFDAVFVYAHDGLQFADLAVLYKFIGQSQTSDDRTVAVLAHPFQYGRAHATAAYTVLDGDYLLEATTHLVQQFLVQWLQESQVLVGDGEF